MKESYRKYMNITRAAVPNNCYRLDKDEGVTCNFSLQLRTHRQMKVQPQQKKTVMPTHDSRSITFETNVILHWRIRKPTIQKCSTNIFLYLIHDYFLLSFDNFHYVSTFCMP